MFANYDSETYWSPGIKPHIIHVSMGYHLCDRLIVARSI